METFALVMLLTFSDSASTVDKIEANVLDSGLTFADCASRQTPTVRIHSDGFVTVDSAVRCEREPIE